MDEAEVFEKVKSIVIEYLGVDEKEVTKDASFMDNLGADSFDAIELTLAFEDKFGVEISKKDEKMLKTVGDIVDFILRQKSN